MIFLLRLNYRFILFRERVGLARYYARQCKLDGGWKGGSLACRHARMFARLALRGLILGEGR